MEGLPPVNIGALFRPPVWGAANGIWLAILYYPAWLLADNLFYSVYLDPRPLTVGLSIVAALVLAFATIVFARAGQGYACQRALSMGKADERENQSPRLHGQNQRTVFEKSEEVGCCHGLGRGDNDRCGNVLQLGYSSDGRRISETYRSFLCGQSLDAR